MLVNLSKWFLQWQTGTDLQTVAYMIVELPWLHCLFTRISQIRHIGDWYSRSGKVIYIYIYTSGRWHRFSRTYPKNHLWTCHLFDASAHTLSLMHMSSARWTPKFLWCVLRKFFSEHTSKTLEGPLSSWQVLSPLCALPLFVGEIQNVRKPTKMKDKSLSIVFPFWCVFIQLLARSWFWWMIFFLFKF